MEFMIGLIAGVIVCLSFKVPPKSLIGKKNAGKHVDVLSTKAHKALTGLERTKSEIAQVSQKAEAAHSELTGKISKLLS